MITKKFKFLIFECIALIAVAALLFVRTGATDGEADVVAETNRPEEYIESEDASTDEGAKEQNEKEVQIIECEILITEKEDFSAIQENVIPDVQLSEQTTETPEEDGGVVDHTDELVIGTETDLDLLALIIYQEAGADWCQDSTRQMVGEVVLNRVEDPRFSGSTIYEILTQEGQYGRLHWTGIVWSPNAYLPQEAHAVKRAYACAEALLSGSVDRLLPRDAVWQAEFTQGVEVLAYQDGVYFCR